MGRRNVRRSQAVVPFGVGAIVDFEDEALLAAGLDAWPDERPDDLLYDERLATRLGVKYFRQPPAHEGEHRDHLPYVRFPYWHFCPRCRALHRLRGNEPRRPQCEVAGESPALKSKDGPGKPSCHDLPPRKRRAVLPLRFVVACQAGHIEDFPWAEWVHAEKGKGVLRGEIGCANAQLYFYPTRRGGLGGLLVHCGACLKRRSMMGATGELRGFACGGARPWLGPGAVEQCERPNPPTVLQRGASNIYFPSAESSVLIPPFSKTVRRIVENPRLWEQLTAQREHGRIPDSYIAIAAAAHGVSVEELRDAVHAKDSGEGVGSPTQTEEEFRFDEYRALLRKSASSGDHLVTQPQELAAYGPIVQGAFESVVLVESLAETRALRGFSRIEDSAEHAALSLRSKNWAPAYRVHGEGIFLVFRQDLFDRWPIGSRVDSLLRRADREPRITLPRTPELLAIHTIAHLLITRLAFDAGYGASSIRERLYCSPAASATPMRGLLLYTAAGDAEGTLGGLVRLGRPDRLEHVLRTALFGAVWCSADPVCRESVGQGLGSLNLAACHACALLPETSCETGNRLLDRLSIVGGGDVVGERPGVFREFLR